MRKVNHLVLYLVIFAAFFLCYLPFLKNELSDYGGDNAQYIIIAQSIVEGKGLRAVNYPGEPLWTRAPLFSLLLVPVVYIFGPNLYILYLYMMILSCLLLLLIYKYLSSLVDSRISLLVTAMVGFSFPFFIYATTRILTEIPFLITIMIYLFWLPRYQNQETVLGRHLFFLALSLIAAYFLRHIGITLYLSAVLCISLAPGGSLKGKLKKCFLLSAMLFIPVLAWYLRNHFWGASQGISSYSSQFFLINPYLPQEGGINFYSLLERIFTNVSYYSAVAIGAFIFSFIQADAILAVAAICVFIGFLLRVKKGASGAEVFFLVYFLFICAWPHRDFIRYLMPLSFLIVYYFYLFCESLAKRFLPAKISRPAVYLLFIVILSGNIIFAAQSSLAHEPRARFQDFRSLHTWLSNEVTDKSAVIVSRKPTITYLYSGFKSFCFPFSDDPDLLMREKEENEASYILADDVYPASRLYLPPFVSKYAGRLEMVYQQGGCAIFKIK